MKISTKNNENKWKLSTMAFFEKKEKNFNQKFVKRKKAAVPLLKKTFHTLILCNFNTLNERTTYKYH